MKQILCCFLLIALAASKSTIPELNKKNGGYFTSDYSTTYNNPVVSGEFGVTSEAGDINNDGVPDFIIGNPANDNSKGIAYVIYGKKGTMRQFNSMNDFQASDGFIIKGAVNGQKLGFCASHIGDVNGDGIDDIIIGSPFWNRDSYATEVGMAYVLFGRKSSSEFPAIVDVDRLSSSQGFKIFGESARNRAGYSVSGGVDVNGDGVSDIIIGAIGAGSGGNTYVIYGSKQGLTDMTLPPVLGKGFTVKGSNQEDSGSSVSKIGDFNGDGVDDIIIGAHNANNWAGKAYIIFGRKTSFPATMYATEGMTLEGMYAGDNFGCTVSNAGDFNGDGLQDVIIGAYGANVGRGGAYVIMGSRSNPSVLNMKATDNASSRGFNLMSSAFSQMSLGVSGGRDINGDGKSDIIIGAPGWNKENGAVYVIYGSSTLVNFWLDNPLTASQGFLMVGTQEGSRFGQFVRMLKDINGDGADDFIVGAFNANGGKGAANLFYLPWKCLDQCATCSKPTYCDTCANGLGMLNGDCVNCPSLWSSINGICVQCQANCLKCSGRYKCDVCVNGFGLLYDSCGICNSLTHILRNGVCIDKCPKNCNQCSSPESCETCNNGYGLSDNQCIDCPANTHFMNNRQCLEIMDKWKPIKDFFGGIFG